MAESRPQITTNTNRVTERLTVTFDRDIKNGLKGAVWNQTIHDRAHSYSDASRCVFLYTNIRKYAVQLYRGADKFLARPISRCILFDGENISFDASFVLYI